MKIIGRLLAILLAVVLVTGGIYYLVENTSLISLGGGAGEMGGRPDFANGQMPTLPDQSTGTTTNSGSGFPQPGSGVPQQGDLRDGKGSEGVGDIRALTGVAQNLGVIALITAGVWLIQKLTGLLIAKRSAKPAGNPS